MDLGGKKGGEENDTSGNGRKGDEASQGLSPGNAWRSLAQVITSSLGSMLKIVLEVIGILVVTNDRNPTQI